MEFKLTKSTPCSCWQRERRHWSWQWILYKCNWEEQWRLLTTLTATPPRRPEDMKWTHPLEAGNVQKAATDYSNEAQDLSPPDAFQMPSISYTSSLFSCNFPCSISSLSRVHLLSDWIFSHSKQLSRRDFLGNQKYSGLLLSKLYDLVHEVLELESHLLHSPFLEFSPSFLLLGLHYNIRNFLILFLWRVMTSFSYLFLYQALH